MTKDKMARIQRAKERFAEAAKLNLTPQQKLDKLDAKFGKGQGAKKERAKLSALLNDHAQVSNKVDASEFSQEVLNEIEEMNKPSKKKSKKKK